MNLQHVHIFIENEDSEPETLVRWFNLEDEKNLRVNAEHLVQEERPGCKYFMSQIIERETIKNER